MKILKALLVIVLLIFFAVFVASFLTPSEYKINVAVTVDANVEKSFSIFNDESNMQEWITGFVSLEKISGENNQVGSTYRVVMQDDGREMEMIETITTFKENEYFSFDLEHDDIYTSVDISFTAIDTTQTELVAKILFIPKAMFVRALMPFFEDAMKARQQNNYMNLKKLIEASPDLLDETNNNMVNETK
jgi:uncharacterized membrane protein